MLFYLLNNSCLCHVLFTPTAKTFCSFYFIRTCWTSLRLFNLYIPLVPVIEKHPESCTVQLGRDCKLFCHVIGKNLKYRWYRRSRCLEGEVSPRLVPCKRSHYPNNVRGVLASWLVRSSPDWGVRVRAPSWGPCVVFLDKIPLTNRV